MTCVGDDWTCEALARLGVRGFAARTVQVLLAHPLKIALILVLTALLARLGARLARRSIQSFGSRAALRETSERASQRATTLGAVSASAIRAVVWTMGLLAVLSEVGINLGPLLAGASIVGVALGFGAQSLVRDFLSGFFILVEDQYGLGDNITIGEVSGVVEEVNLRLTRVRSADGTMWFVPNGEIRKVGNAALGWATVTVDVGVPRTCEVAAAMEAVRDEVEKLGRSGAAEGQPVFEQPELLGLEAVSHDSYTLRVTARARPGDRFAVARLLRAAIARRLQEETSPETPDEEQAAARADVRTAVGTPEHDPVAGSSGD